MEEAERDSVDRVLAKWAPHLPDIDLEVEAIVERVQKLGRMLTRSMERTLGEFGLNWGEWNVLGYLRRSGDPYAASPGELARHTDLSSGAMTNRLDRLEAAGLIRRLPDPEDRRGVRVQLTDAGHRAWLDSVGAQAQKEALVAGALDDREKKQLNTLLRRLVVSLERSGIAPDDGKHDA